MSAEELGLIPHIRAVLGLTGFRATTRCNEDCRPTLSSDRVLWFSAYVWYTDAPTGEVIVVRIEGAANDADPQQRSEVL